MGRSALLLFALLRPCPVWAAATLHGAAALAIANIPHAALGHLAPLARALDPASPDNLTNRYVLEPLLSALQAKHPNIQPRDLLGENAAELLAPAWVEAQEQVQGWVSGLADDVKNRRLSPAIAPGRLALDYELARMLLWYHQPYLDDVSREKLTADIWPALKDAPDQLRRARDIRRERVESALTETEKSLVTPRGGLLAPKKEGDAREEIAEELKRRFLEGEDTADADGHAFPLNAVKAQYLWKLRILAGVDPDEHGQIRTDIYGFWDWADSALRGAPFSGFEGRLKTDVLGPLERIGRLGPRGGALIESAREQNELLFQLIDGLKPEAPPDYYGDMNLHKRRRDEINGLLEKRKLALLKAEDKARSRAHQASQALLAYGGESDGAITAPLAVLADYYGRLFHAAWKDAADPSHGWEAARLAREGESGDMHILNLASVRDKWAYARSQGTFRTLAFNAGALALTAAFLHLMWIPRVLEDVDTAVPLIGTAAGTLAALVSIKDRSVWGTTIIAGATALFPLMTQSWAQTLLFAGLGTAIGALTYWMTIRPIWRALRFRRLGRRLDRLAERADF